MAALNNTSIRYAVTAYCSGIQSLVIVNTYGTIDKWDTGDVTEMDGLFYKVDCKPSPNITYWNTGMVQTMSAMFFESSTFNSPIRLWDVRNVGDMSNMFESAFAFNQDIGEWDVR